MTITESSAFGKRSDVDLVFDADRLTPWFPWSNNMKGAETESTTQSAAGSKSGEGDFQFEPWRICFGVIRSWAIIRGLGQLGNFHLQL